MKTFLTLALAGLFTLPAFSQEDTASPTNSEDIVVTETSERTVIIDENQDTTIVNVGVVSVIETPEGSVVSVGPEGTVVIDENKDTTRIKVGKKGIIIIEGDKGTQVNIENIEEDEDFDSDEDIDESDEDESDEDGNKKFKPHWAGFEVGINNYFNSDMSMSLDNSMSFMDLNTGRSWNFNINFLDYGFGFGTDKIGLVTGLGLEWNNYHFDHNNTIKETAMGIEPDTLFYSEIKKNRLQSTYLRAPLLLEFQIPAGKKRIYLSAGPVVGVKLGSNTKIVYKENGDEQKLKDKDDYNLSPLRYGFTARAGYGGLKLFANYYMTPLFEANKGPELYPFSVGLTLLDF